MSVVRVVRNQQYTVINNSPLQDRRLSLKARGLLAYCFSLPADWHYSIEGLVSSIGSDGRDAIRGALTELEKCGYLKRRRLHDDRGKFTDTEYLIYESAQTEALNEIEAESEKSMPEDTPVDKDCQTTDNPAVENPTLDKPTTQKPTLGNPSLVDLQGSAPITENPTLVKPTQGKPTLENHLQQTKYINKINSTTTTDESMQENMAMLPEVCRLAKVCRVNEQTLEKAVKGFGAAMVGRYLSHMTGQQNNIKNPNAWLIRALKEKWELAGNGYAPRPDCPECGGSGYTIRGYIDVASGQTQKIRIKCAKCRGF